MALVACWPMQEGTGTTAADRGTHGHDLAVTGSQTWTAVSERGIAGSRRAWSSALVRTNHYWSRANFGSTFPASWTFMVWALFAAADENQIKGIMGLDADASGGEGTYRILRYQTGAGGGKDLKVQLQIRRASDGVAQQRIAGAATNADTWTHIAATYDAASTNAYLYLDGVQQGAALAIAGGPLAVRADSPLLIGGHFGSDAVVQGYTLTGSLCWARLYDSALTAAEILALRGQRWTLGEVLE